MQEANLDWSGKFCFKVVNIVCNYKVHCMQSIQMLGESGGMPLQENFKNGWSEIESDGIFDSSVHCTIVHD